MESNNYYVYEFIRLDYNEPFYIGKGSGNRWKELKRGNNDYFNNICKSISVAVVILHDNLEETEALQIESWYIWQLRDIQGYNLVNITDGGEGVALRGKKNGFYGKVHTEETKELIRDKIHEKIEQGIVKSGNYKGKNHKEESKQNISKSVKEFWSNADENFINDFKEKVSGENNGMYGKQHTEDSRQKMKLSAKNRKYKDKKCIVCSNYFSPSGNRATKCSECKTRVK